MLAILIDNFGKASEEALEEQKSKSGGKEAKIMRIFKRRSGSIKLDATIPDPNSEKKASKSSK